MNQRKLILTCEHAVDTVPSGYQALFAPHQEVLATHRGIDFGAQEIALHLQESFHCPLIQAKATRLLIDCNRSLHHSGCLSEITQNLPPKTIQNIIDEYYTPYREKVLEQIQHDIEQGFQVLHLSIHSFTPLMNNEIRNTDIGLLYDPKRTQEKEFCAQWKKEMRPMLKVRSNYPYKGTSDGFTTFLRRRFSEAQYLGIEVESNQALTRNSQFMDTVKNGLADSLLKVFG